MRGEKTGRGPGRRRNFQVLRSLRRRSGSRDCQPLSVL